MRYAILIALIVSGFSLNAEAKKSHNSRNRAEARKACLAENPELKGKALKACVKGKRK